MNIGISTASFYPLETENALRMIAEHNIGCAEIFFNSKRELKDSFIDYILDISEQSGLKISAIHPMLSFAEPYALFSEYQRRFDEGMDDYKRYFEIAERLGAKFVSLHGDRPTGRLPVEDYCERFALLTELGTPHGVTLCQENVNGYRSADPEFLAEMVQILGDGVAFTLDVKQCLRAGHTVNEIAEAMNYQIKHLHISDHSPASDCLLPTKGGFDFKGLTTDLALHGYKGDYMIEVYKDAYCDYEEIFESHAELIKTLQP